jgi:hypothetical protein
VQTQGSLQESSLASLLQTMQTERATGALAVESADESASLYFLFGHLFHAAGPGGQGEDVVIHALGWQDGNFKFDPRAKLPPEETIKASPSELVAEAERRGPVGAAGQPVAADTGGAWATAGYAGGAQEVAPGPAQFEPAFAQPGEEYPAATWGTPQPEYGAGYAPEPAAAPATGADTTWAAPAPDAPKFEVPAYEAPAPTGYEVPQAGHPETPQAETYQAPAETYQAPVASGYPDTYQVPTAGAQAPAGADGTDTAAGGGQAVFGAPAAPPLDILYPLPSGRSQYEGLKSAFVDFPKLLRTLRGDQHTGYVRLTGGDFSGVLLFHSGQLLQALSSDAHAQAGDSAFLAVRRQMDAGTGTIDVIELSGDVVDALAQLLTAPLLYTGLLGRFVNFNSLLEYLAEEKVEGAVVVVGAEDVGIILFRQGEVLGAYTKVTASLDTSTGAVAKIAAEKTARIEVKSGTGQVAAIDIETALNRPY